MSLLRAFPVAVLSLAVANTQAAPPVPVEAPLPDTLRKSDAASPETAEEREQARAAFLDARREYVETLASILASEELARTAHEVSVRIDLRRSKDRLEEVRSRLEVVEGAGRSETDEARRLRERIKTLEVEIDALRHPDPAAVDGETGRLVLNVISGRFRKAMTEETDYLADVLSTSELEERTHRLRRLVTVTRIAAGLRQVRQERADQADSASKSDNIVPAGGITEPTIDSPEASLGSATTAPPDLKETPSERDQERRNE